MKKNASFISVDSALAAWLCEAMETARPRSASAQELLQGMRALESGEVTTLVLGMDGEDQPALMNREDCLRAGNLAIYPKNRRVSRDEVEVFLTPKEFDILLFLMEHRGEIFTKEQIYQAVWDEDFLLADSNIMAFIRKLRKKVEPNPDAPEYILTIWGIGYKFNDEL